MFALPMVKRGIQKLGEGRVTLESFLGGSIVAATLAGEAQAALEILWVTSGGELLQQWITARSRRAIRDILQATEKEAYILADGVEVSVPVEQVRPGDTVVLHTGEKIAVDGKVVKGEALVDESSITGEATFVTRTEGDKVFAGTFVRQGVIFVEARQVGDRTYLARILRMVEDSMENKAPIEGVADRLAKSVVKWGFAATLATLLLTRSPWRAFTVMLVMACPCATILAGSTAISAAMSAAAHRRILIKGGRYLEEAGKANVICFDKTGTLTTNEPDLKQIEIFDGFSEDDLLQLAYSTEIHNNHPVAIAIKREAEKRGIEPIGHDVCEYYLGKGVRSEIRRDEILVGSHKLMDQFSVAHAEVKTYLDKVKRQGLTLLFIAKNGELLGVVGIANRDRANVGAVVDFFRKDGFDKVSMVTGDSKYSALEVSCRLNFDECHYSVMPEEKSEIVAGLKSKGDKVLMVGDGINEALALTEADIGVAMGAGGSEVAIEAADIALVEDELKGVVYVRLLSKETIRVVRQNFWIAMGSNIAGVALRAMGLLSPLMAGLVHIAHTLGILANSSRLLNYEPSPDFSRIEGLPKNVRQIDLNAGKEVTKMQSTENASEAKRSGPTSMQEVSRTAGRPAPAEAPEKGAGENWGMGLPVLMEGAETLLERGVKVEVLDAAAVGFSLWRKDYFTANSIVALLALGEYLEELSEDKAAGLLKGLLKPQVEHVWVERDGKDVRVGVEEVVIGDWVVCGSGELIPVDGVVIDGDASVNQSSITGESIPVHLQSGDEALSGSVIEEGRLKIEARRVGSETGMARIGRFLENSLRTKSESQKKSDELADRLVPATLGLGLLLFLMTRDVRRAAAVLTVDYSCAIKLANPVAVRTAMYTAARSGVLNKGAYALDTLAHVDTVVFDKTGTLTRGVLEVTDIVSTAGMGEDDLLALAAAAEEHYAHPVAKAVLQKAREKGLELPPTGQVDFIVAHGVSAYVDDRRVLVGSRHFIEDDEYIDCSPANGHAQRLRNEGKTLLYIARQNVLEWGCSRAAKSQNWSRRS